MKKLIGWKTHLTNLLKGVNEDEQKLEKLKDDFSGSLRAMIEEEKIRNHNKGA